MASIFTKIINGEIPSYKVAETEDYYAFLEKLSNSRGLIFHPAGFDTCPRVTIEAKLLGCELDLGDMVQHKDEEWFQDESSIYEHIRERYKQR